MYMYQYIHCFCSVNTTKLQLDCQHYSIKLPNAIYQCNDSVNRNPLLYILEK